MLRSPREKALRKYYQLATILGALLLTFVPVLPALVEAQDKLLSAVLPPDPVLAAFGDLEAHVLSQSQLGRGQRVSLQVKLEAAEAAYRRGLPCTALNVLDAYLNQTQALRRGSLVAVAEDLHARGRLLRGDLAGRLPEGRACRGLERIGGEASVEVLTSDNRHLRGRVAFGEPRMWGVAAGGELFTQLGLPGSQPVGQAGLPGVPVVYRLVAVPRGADVSVTTSPPVVAETLRLNLHPFQPEPADQDAVPDPFADRPFAKDGEAYASPGPFPPEVCRVERLGQVRDLPIAQVACAAGQYNPAADTLTLFRSVDFEVRFGGGSGFFVTRASLNPFEPPSDQYTGPLLNQPDVLLYVDHAVPEPRCSGEELLILTAPDLAAAAEGLAQWKRSKGIATTVVSVGATTTADQIDAFIEDRFDRCAVRLSYVLLLGDAELLPTFYPSTEFSPKTGSDYRYAAYPQFILDILPDFGVGRIPVDTLQQAWDVVDKIIGYESAPPTDADFYQRVSIAAQFQCCRPPWDVPLGQIPTKGWDWRGFIEISEFARDLLMGRGYTVQRIYTKTDDPSYTNPDKTARRYHDGTLLPSDLGGNSAFAWNGSTQDIVDALNQGRFLFLHRDHGSWNGWSHPALTKDDVDTRLTNGARLPVVFSINCSTGFFDNETNPSGDHPLYPSVDYPNGAAVRGESYFAERLLRLPSGGAVGVIAATRDSPSWANDALTRGLFDAVWPTQVRVNAPPPTPIRRLGDMLNRAKLRVFTEMAAPGADVDVSPLADAASELFLWHVLGDPTLELWTSRPALLAAFHSGVETLAGALRVHYALEGATITALQVRNSGDSLIPETLPIGRATVKDGVATLPFVVPPWPEVPVLLSVCARGSICRPLLAPGGGDHDIGVGVDQR